MIIKFNERYQAENELELLRDALTSSNLSSDGKYTNLLKKYFFGNFNMDHILFTPSATSALELAVQMLDLLPGDEVIIPSFNFPSAANAVLKSGGHPVLCDVDPDTKCISPEDVESRISSRTKAVIPTHYAGISCDMGVLANLATANGLTIIEDAAQAVGSYYKQSPLGTIADFGVFSFHHTKNFSCGEGGAFICKDGDKLENAEILRDNGTNKIQFLKNMVSSYSWETPGSNFIMSELCAVLLYAQLISHDDIIAKRKSIADIYDDAFSQERVFLKGKIKPMIIPDYSKPNYHIYYIDCVDSTLKEKLKYGLLQDGVDVRSHFVPLHMSTFGNKLGYRAADIPNSYKISETLLRLPMHTEISYREAEFIADRLIKRVNDL